MKPFSLKQRLKSFTHAYHGLKLLFKEEPNARIHLLAAGLAVLLSWLFKLSSLEWVAILLAIGFVFAMELINSSIENLADFVSPENQDAIKKVKDLAAAGVLICALTSVLIALAVFMPKIMNF
jgi:diacylglycerol kinase